MSERYGILERYGWCGPIGVVICTGLLAAACESATVSCTETATCKPTVRPEGGVDASSEAGESDASSWPDAPTEPTDPPRDVEGERTNDSPWSEDGEAGSYADAREDSSDAPLTDVASEPDACDPGTSKSPLESSCLISEKYGVFVSPQGSDTTGVGTRSAPYKTLAKALQGAKGNVMRVYACDDGAGYTDALTIDATFDGMSLYGGFECAGWTYATALRARVHPATGVALMIKGLTVGVTVEDFEFDAADAATGESSIGGIVETALNVVLRGVKIVAGKGGAGVDGVDGVKGDDALGVGPQQAGGSAVCPAQVSQQSGGMWNMPTLCGSQGGNGGPAAQNNDGAPGYPGNPRTGVTQPDVDNGGAKGLTGQDGKAGSPGNVGQSGTASLTAGTFGELGFTVAAAGGNGTAGNVGQGGGGGGASNALPLSGCIGASGGAGGMGGCGGSPGKGGASAGASVALLVWMSPITLDRSELTSAAGGGGGNGGNGGHGGHGKVGAPGGAAYVTDAGPAPDAGMGLGPGGSGGPGGNGGNGGSGAGGNGGPSYALVYKGITPTRLNGTLLAHGAAGAKGIGGTVDLVTAPDGLPGTAADEYPVP